MTTANSISTETVQATIFSYERWRKSFLKWILRGASLVGFIVMVAASVDEIQQGRAALAIVYAAAWLALLAITLNRWPYGLRTAILLILIYGLGVSGLLENGMRGDARLFLFVFVVMSAMLIDPRAGLAGLGLSLLTIAVVAWFVLTRRYELMNRDAVAGSLSLWVVSSITLILLSTLVLTGLTLFLREFSAAQEGVRQMLNALAQERTLLRTLIDNLPDSVYAKDLQGRKTLANRADLQHMGVRTEAEALGKTDLEIYPAELAIQYHAGDRQVLQTGQPLINYEESVTDAAGHQRWLLTSKLPLRDAEGKVVGLVGIGRDITERKRAEAEREQWVQALQRHTIQLQTAAQVSKSAITLLDPKVLMQQTVNLIRERFDFYYVGLFLVDEAGEYAVLHAGTGEAGRQMLETGHRLPVGSGSMIGWSVAHQQPRLAQDAGEEPARFDNPLLPATRSELALPLCTRGKAIGALSVQSARPAAFPEDDVSVLQTMADQLAIAIENARLYEASQQEIARRIQAEETVLQLNQDLERRVAERTRQLEAAKQELEAFAYSVSHDLKAPLRGIDGYGRLLLEDYAGRLDEEGQFFVRTIRQAAEQMRQLIDDLLAYSRLERRPFAAGRVSPRALVEAILLERASDLRERKVDVVVDVSCESVMADAEGLAQALRNLVDNALKFTRDEAEPRIEIGSGERTHVCTLWVRDNGIGFDMQFHDRIFEVFQRLHRAEDYPGTGIGLALVRKAVQRMGGRVWAESAPGAGATFYMEIPR